MRLTLYILSFIFSFFLIGSGLIGSIETAVSYKYEVDDPTVQIVINRLNEYDQKNEIEHLEKKKQGLNSKTIFYGIVIALGITSSSVLIIKRKRIFKHV